MPRSCAACLCGPAEPAELDFGFEADEKNVVPDDLLPAAVLTAGGLVALVLISNFVMQYWVDFYALITAGLASFWRSTSGSCSARR